MTGHSDDRGVTRRQALALGAAVADTVAFEPRPGRPGAHHGP
ncbi:hypothetical protein A6P39_038250 [Streptomyces sp. FXJ1.172]|nr:hypothetical protein [Streptomyces sp. FXJ1.172]WEO99415.1 hypothetical protein A6P39_038250 [Streptomyces sp. FXJ1.172]